MARLVTRMMPHQVKMLLMSMRMKTGKRFPELAEGSEGSAGFCLLGPLPHGIALTQMSQMARVRVAGFIHHLQLLLLSHQLLLLSHRMEHTAVAEDEVGVVGEEAEEEGEGEEMEEEKTAQMHGGLSPWPELRGARLS